MPDDLLMTLWAIYLLPLPSDQTVMSGAHSPENRKNLMISVAFDHVCSCLVAAYRWSIVGHDVVALRNGPLQQLPGYRESVPFTRERS